MLHRSFKPAKCKTSLKLVASRLKLLKNKKEVVVKQLRRDLAQLLESGQDQTARIRVEHVVREEKMMAAYELLEIFCELIAIRLPIIESQKNCPIDLKEAVTSVIFATPRCSDINELKDIQKQFTAKYGKEFVSAAIELRPDCGVNRNLIEKLSAKAPDGPTKIKILAAIAEEHNIKWEPKGFGEKESNHQEDSLSGPKTYENASKMHAETSNIQSSYYDRVSPNVHIHPENEVNKVSPSNYQGNDAKSSFGSENITTSRVGASAAPNPNLKPSGNGADRMESSSTHFEDHSPNFVDQKNWNMDFKDAASAAQAAAESAERASMAARVAAELSSQGKIVTQYTSGSHSSPVHKDEMPRKPTGSSFDSEASARGQKSNNFEDRSSRTQHEDLRAKEQHNFIGHKERISGDGNRSNNRSSQISTAAFTSGSTKSNDPSSRFPIHGMNDQSTQSYDGYYQAQTSVDEDEEDDIDLSTLTEVLRGDGRRNESGSHSRSEKTSGDFVPDEADARRNSRRLPHAEDVDEFTIRSQSPTFEVEALEVTEDSWRTQKATDFDGERVTELSPYAESYSRSSRSSSYSDGEGDMEPNTQKLKYAVGNPFAIVNEEKYHDGAKTTNESGSVLFDDYGSDGENPIFDMDKGPETISNVFSPDRKSTSLLSENSNAPSTRKYRADLFDKDISEPRSSRDESSAFVFSERLDDSDVQPHEDELPPIFDDASPSPSESEDEPEHFKTDQEDNSSSELKKSQSNFVQEVSDKFEDLDDKKIQDRHRHSRVGSAPESDDDNWPMNEPASFDNSDGATGLSFEKLTGGLKNKGYRHLPYTQSLSTAASSPKEAVAVEKKHPVSNPPKNWSSSDIVDDFYKQEVDSGAQRKSSTTASYRTSSKDEASASRKSLEDTAEKSSFSTPTSRKSIDAAIDGLYARDKYVESRRKSGKPEEKSRRSLSGEVQLPDQAVLDTSTQLGLSGPPRQHSGRRLALNSHVKDSGTGRRSSSQESISSYDLDQSEDREEEVLSQVPDSKIRYGASRRTRATPLKADRSSNLKPSPAPQEEETRESQKFSLRSSGIARKTEVKPARSSDDDEIQEGTAFTKSSLRSSDGNDGYRSAQSEMNSSDDRRGFGRLPMGREAMERETQEPSKYTSSSSYSDRRSQVKPGYLSAHDENPEVSEDKKSSLRSSYGTDRTSSGRPQLGEGAQGPIEPSSQSSYMNRRSSEEAENSKGEVVGKSSRRSSYYNEDYRGNRRERAASDDRGSSDRLRPGKESMGEGTRVPTQPSSRSSHTDRRSEATAAYTSKEVESPERVVAHKRSSSRSSDGNEAYRGSRQERQAPDDKGSSDQLQPRKEAPAKLKSEFVKSERPSVSPHATSGSSGPGDSSKATRPSLEDTSRENSFNKASHVHEKLPDSDSFFAMFESLKQNRK